MGARFFVGMALQTAYRYKMIWCGVKRETKNKEEIAGDGKAARKSGNSNVG